jgi:Protein of unknown function (DUF1569)
VAEFIPLHAGLLRLTFLGDFSEVSNNKGRSAMKSLFNRQHNDEIIERLNRLTPETKGVWGKMNVSQMLAHTQQPLRVAFGELKLKRSIVGILVGPFAKKKLSNEEQWRHNMPTDKNFIIGEERNFEGERQKLTALVRRFAELGPAGLSGETHPFFGKLTVDEWDRLMWNHLDHHLRQFGA